MISLLVWSADSRWEALSRLLVGVSKIVRLSEDLAARVAPREKSSRRMEDRRRRGGRIEYDVVVDFLWRNRSGE